MENSRVLALRAQGVACIRLDAFEYSCIDWVSHPNRDKEAIEVPIVLFFPSSSNFNNQLVEKFLFLRPFIRENRSRPSDRHQGT